MKKLLLLLLFPVLALAQHDRLNNGIITGTFDMSGSSSKTGTGNVVLATSASLTTPTITSGTFITPALGVATATQLTVNGTITIAISPMSAIFDQAESTPSSGGVAAKELRIRAGGSFSNTVSFMNPATDGYGAISFRNASNREVMALGPGNSGAGAIWGNLNYWENEPFDGTNIPAEMAITADGVYGPIAHVGTLKLYKRLRLVWNATNSASEWNIPHLIPWNDGTDGASQKTAFQFATGTVSASSNALPFMKFNIQEGSETVEFWNAQPASASFKVVAFGTSSPAGGGLTGDFQVSGFNTAGGGWREILRMGNDGNMFSWGAPTSSNPGIKKNSASLRVRLGDDSNFASLDSLYDRFASGTPESAVTAPIGSLFHRTDGSGAAAIYAKTSGAGNTGWDAVATLAGSQALTSKTYNGLTVTTSTGTLTITNAKTLSASNSITIAGTDGKTLTMSNSLTFSGTDGSTLNIGTGGTLGTAAYTASTAYQASSATLSNIANNTAASSVSNNNVAYTVLSLTTPTVSATSTSTGGLTVNAGTAISRIKHGRATLVSGTVTVTDVNVTANTRIIAVPDADGGSPLTTVRYTITRSAGANWTITAKVAAGTTNTSDTSTLAWETIEP